MFANSSTWVVAGSGLPMVDVAGLTIVPRARLLYAATHDRSAWKLTLPQMAVHKPDRKTWSILGRSAIAVPSARLLQAFESADHSGADRTSDRAGAARE
jgi:hypothetical protein